MSPHSAPIAIPPVLSEAPAPAPRRRPATSLGRPGFVAAVGVVSLFGLTVPANAATHATPDGGVVWGTSTSRVSVGAAGAEADLDSYCCPDISADGRYVAFESDASNLVAGDTNNKQDIFVQDRLTHRIQRVSVASDGAQADGLSYTPSLSDNGRVVVFGSDATNLVPGDTNGTTDVFLYDLDAGTTSRVSITSTGGQPNGPSYFPAISGDAEAIVFQTDASNMVPGDTNGASDIIVRDRTGTITDRVSVSSAERPGNGASTEPVISRDGRYVVYGSEASNLVSGDTNSAADLFLRDRTAGTTERITVGPGGVQGTGSHGLHGLAAAVTADGRFVTFTAYQSNLVADDTNGTADAFVRDRTRGTNTLVSLDAKGDQIQGTTYASSASASGRQVAFYTDADHVVPGDRNGKGDIFVRDLKTQRTGLVTVGTDGGADRDSGGGELSSDGRHVAFCSDATNLVAGDTDSAADIFVRDRASLRE